MTGQNLYKGMMNLYQGMHHHGIFTTPRQAGTYALSEDTDCLCEILINLAVVFRIGFFPGRDKPVETLILSRLQAIKTPGIQQKVTLGKVYAWGDRDRPKAP